MPWSPHRSIAALVSVLAEPLSGRHTDLLELSKRSAMFRTVCRGGLFVPMQSTSAIWNPRVAEPFSVTMVLPCRSQFLAMYAIRTEELDKPISTSSKAPSHLESSDHHRYRRRPTQEDYSP